MTVFVDSPGWSMWYPMRRRQKLSKNWPRTALTEGQIPAWADDRGSRVRDQQ